MAHILSQELRKSTSRKAQATHDRLLQAALTLMTEQGYHRTTTPAIARRAGVAEGTIYRHFSSKQDLLNEIYREGVRVFLDEVNRTAGADSRSRLQETAVRWQRIAAQDAPLARLVWLYSWRDLLDQQSLDARQQIEGAVEQIVAAGKASGAIRAGPDAVLADVWLALVRHVIEQTAAGRWSEGHSSAQLVLAAAWDAVQAGAPARHQSPAR